MKNRTLILIPAFLFSAQCIFAQITAGAKAAILVNDTELSGSSLDTDKTIKPLTGYALGLQAEYPLNQSISVKSELLYKRFGFQLNEGTQFNVLGLNIPIGASITTRINQLEIPMLLKYKRNIGEIFLTAETGPSLSYALSGHIETKANSLIDFKVNKTNLNFSSNNYNRFGIIGNIGIGIEYLTTQAFLVSANIRYSRDLSSQIELPIIDAGMKNNTLSFNVGVAQRF